MSYWLSKRAADVLIAALAIVILLPVYCLIAFAVRLKLGRPVLFVQTRSGKNGVPFLLYKFRSMSDELDEEGVPRPDSERLTGFGVRLRASSMDELPELWNVLVGDMSLVGPRPLLPEYDSLYDATQARRLEVRPGITGLAQVRGRNALSWDERFAYDVDYVDHVSLRMDVRILLETVRVVAGGSGVNQDGEATCAPFVGRGGDEGSQ